MWKTCDALLLASSTWTEKSRRRIVVRCPLLFSAEMSVGEKSWVKPDELAIAVLLRRDLVRDVMKIMLELTPSQRYQTTSSEPFINTIKTPDDAGVTLSTAWSFWLTTHSNFDNQYFSLDQKSSKSFVFSSFKKKFKKTERLATLFVDALCNLSSSSSLFISLSLSLFVRKSYYSPLF